MKVSLRRATAEDREFLFTVFASTRDEELALVDWAGDQKTAFLRMQFEAQDQYYRQQFADAEFLILLLNGRPAGRLYVQRSAEEILLIDIALLPGERNAGVGGMLLRDLQTESRESGKPLRIHVERFNRARNLYSRMGFVKLAEHGLYDLMEWRAGPLS